MHELTVFTLAVCGGPGYEFLAYHHLDFFHRCWEQPTGLIYLLPLYRVLIVLIILYLYEWGLYTLQPAAKFSIRHCDVRNGPKIVLTCFRLCTWYRHLDLAIFKECTCTISFLFLWQNLAWSSLESCSDSVKSSNLNPVSYEWESISQWTWIWKKGWYIIKLSFWSRLRAVTIQFQVTGCKQIRL